MMDDAQNDNWWQQDAQAPTGEAYKASLPPARAAIAQAMVDGRVAIPTGAALRSAAVQQQLQDAAMIDPTFDAVNSPSRTATRKAFTSGTQAKNITSFNTALGHLGSMAQSVEDLHNGSIPFFNSVANAVEPQLGNTDVAGALNQFGTDRQAVVEELGRAFKGAAPDVHGSKGWEANFSTSQSPEALRRSIAEAAKLLQSRIGAMHDSYNNGMGTTNQPLPMLDPHALDTLAKLQSKDYLEKGYGAVIGAAAGDHPNGPTMGTPGPRNGPDGGPPPPAGGQPSLLSNTPGAPVVGQRVASDDGSGEFLTAKDKSFAADTQALLNQKGTTRAEFDALAEKYGRSAFGADLDAAIKLRDTGKGITQVRANPTGHRDATLLSAAANSAPGAAVIGAGDTVSFGMLPKAVAGASAISDKLSGADQRDLGSIYTDSLADTHSNMDFEQRQHPLATLAGETAGFIGGDGIVGALPGVAKLAGKVPALIRPALGDAIYGGLYGAGSSDHLADVPGNTIKGAALSALGGTVGRGVVKAGSAVLSPIADGAVRRLTDAGVTLTPGQILGASGGTLGNMAKATEDRLGGFPVVGDIIQSARRTGVEDFNRAATNDALAPIGAKLPDDVSVGHEGIQHAGQLISDQYDRALSAMKAVPDAQLTTDLQGIAQKANGLSQDHRTAFQNILDTDLQPYISGKKQIDGADLQSIKQGLDKEIADYSSPTASPQDKKLAERLGDVRDAVLNLAGRTDPASASEFAKANQAYSLFSRVQGAAAKAKDGVFTPNQFRQAVTKRGYGTTTANVARGSAPMQQLSTDASTILPSTINDSGTAGRAALGLMTNKALAAASPGAALGGVEGYREHGIGGALAGATLGAAAFSRPGLRAMQWTLAGSRGKVSNTLGDLLRRNAALGGAAGSPLLLSHLSNEGN